MKSSTKLVLTGKENPPKKVHPKSSCRSCVSNDQSQFLKLERAIGNRAMGQLIQAKLIIGAPNDKYEQEADRVADMVMRMPNSEILADEEGRPEYNDVIRTKPLTPLYIQRSYLECDEALQQGSSNPPNIQTKSGGSFPAAKKVAKSLQSPGNGNPLPGNIRSKVEPVLGINLSHVKVHSDYNATQAAKSINAKAFTHQNNIYLGKDQSANDLSLMAHEATHVLQQNTDLSVKRIQCDPVDKGSPTLGGKSAKEIMYYGPVEFFQQYDRIAEIEIAKMTYDSLKKALDARGWEIFELWLKGHADDEVIFENEEWKQYMSAEKSLEQTILNNLRQHAEFIRLQLGKGFDQLDGNLRLQFHAEVGYEYGGYFDGYNLLHGTNSNVGGFQVQGTFYAHKSNFPPGSTIVVYKDLQFTFNDIIDPNKMYAMDIHTERITRNMCKVLGIGPPKNYILRIRWKQDDPVHVHFGPGGELFFIGHPEAPVKTGIE